MSFSSLMSERWSCRSYRQDPVDEETLRSIFATAQQTASWCNTQAWQVHLLQGDALTDFSAALTAHASQDPRNQLASSDFPLPARYVGVFKERQRDAGFKLYASLGIERNDYEARTAQSLRNFSFFEAPHGLIITTDRDHGIYGAIDCGAYVANLMNAALERGVASVAQGAFAIHAGKVRELLDLPEDRLVVCGVALGFPHDEHPVNQFRTSRASLAELVHTV